VTSDRSSSTADGQNAGRPTDASTPVDAADSSGLSLDDQRMLRLQQGERSAYDEIVSEYQGPLFGFFFRNTRDAQLSEDLTQETLLRVYSQFWDYLPVGRFRGWLYRIARNLLIDNIRRQPHDVLFKATRGRRDDDTALLTRLAGAVFTPEEIVDQRELAGIVDECLAEIPDDQRMTFTLHHYSGLSLPEVADVMQSNVPTTKSRLRLAREKLREKLRQFGIHDPHARREE
jgi:RNA polymerase sigma-70 factor (ECF subfamily)